MNTRMVFARAGVEGFWTGLTRLTGLRKGDLKSDRRTGLVVVRLPMVNLSSTCIAGRKPLNPVNPVNPVKKKIELAKEMGMRMNFWIKR